MRSRARLHWRRRQIALFVCAAALVWLVISHSLAAYLADPAPRVALWLNPWQAEALVNLADDAINRPADVSGRAPQPQDLAPGRDAPQARNPSQDFAIVQQNSVINLPDVRQRLVAAVTYAPLNARALRILGQVASIGNDGADASKFMAAAAQLSLHSGIAVYWMMRKSTEAGDYQSAVYYADALLRTNPGLQQYVEPFLAHLAEKKDTSDLIKSVLKTNPPWREEFFKDLPPYISDARTPLELFLALRTSRTPPDSDEINDYLRFLIAHKYYKLAYYTWLQFLPPENLRKVGLLFNGGFDIVPSGSPFDWVIEQGSGVTIDIVPTPDKVGGHALLLDFLFGRVDYHSIRELVVLAPGTYRFSGEYKGKLLGPRGLKWRLACVGDAGTLLGESPMITGTNSTWEDVDFPFTVPTNQCTAQYVSLDLDARMASEELVTGSILFDGLQIARAGEQPAPAAAK